MQAKSMIVLCVIATLCIWSVQSQFTCPTTKVSCTTTCFSNSDCLSGLCCPNKCNGNSCVDKSAATKGNSGYKQGSSGATGTYCGNTKCRPNEKCTTDQKTKLPKCSSY